MDNDKITFNDVPRLMGDMMAEIKAMRAQVTSLEQQARMIPVTPSTEPVHRPLSTEQVCKLVHRKRDTIYRLARTGCIPCYKQGKFLEFFEDEIMEWLKTNKYSTNEQMISDARAYCNANPL